VAAPSAAPCHRVIGADGSLTGYGGGKASKEFLIRLERDGARVARASPRTSERSHEPWMAFLRP
jgi:hypothetical protein